MNQNKFSHIIWDWNGTLLDDIDLCLKIINQILKSRGLPLASRDRYLDIFRFPVQKYYEKLGFNFDEEPFEPISTEFITAYENGRRDCQLMSGAEDTLLMLSEKGYSQSILSASKQTYLQKALDEYNVTSFFISINGLDNHHAAGKSRIARSFMATNNLNPDVVLLLGDTLHDAEIASELGIDCWLISQGHQSKKRLATAGVPILDSILELAGLL
jgi:phosphoglycolate phosphatase